MGVVPANAYNAFNVACNGGFEFWNGDPLTQPDGWVLTNVSSSPVGPVNAFRVVEKTPTQDEEPTRRIEVDLQSDSIAVFGMAQFNVAPTGFDFPVPHVPPAVPETAPIAHHMAEGYLSTERSLVAHHALTISLAVQILDAPVSIHVGLDETPGDGGSTNRTLVLPSEPSGTQWRRVHIVAPARSAFLRAISLGFVRTPDRSARVNWGRVCVALGAYDYLPYTGNPEDELWPKDTVVMVAGSVCPPGFDPFDPERDEKFIRGSSAIGPDGGAPKHNHGETTWPLPPLEESQNIITDAGSGPTKFVRYHPTDNFELDGPADQAIEHDHTMTEQRNTPTSRGVLLCRKR